MSDSETVTLQELLFTRSWEDPALDREALQIGPGRSLATVASGGCNALTFLLDDPDRVFAFDYNPTQVWTLELKRAAFGRLDHDALLELFGVRPSTRRPELLQELAGDLSAEALRWWQDQPWLLESGLLGGGRYERFVGMFRRLLRLIHGKKRILALFEERTIAEQAAFYDDKWDTWAWRLVFKTFFNKRVLARRGLSPEYFTFDDGSASFAESFSRRAAHAMRDLPVRGNPFLACYTMGGYLDEEHLPVHLRPESFELIRARLDRLQIAVGDVRDVFDPFEDGELHGICLSNVFELMSEEETASVLPRVARVLAPGGRMTLRNLMVPRSVNAPASEDLVLEADLSRALLEQDRSFVYRSFQAYTRRPAASGAAPSVESSP